MDSKNVICSNCHKIFPFYELYEKEKKLYGITTKELVCPFCGSHEWSTEQDIKYFRR